MSEQNQHYSFLIRNKYVYLYNLLEKSYPVEIINDLIVDLSNAQNEERLHEYIIENYTENILEDITACPKLKLSNKVLKICSISDEELDEIDKNYFTYNELIVDLSTGSIRAKVTSTTIQKIKDLTKDLFLSSFAKSLLYDLVSAYEPIIYSELYNKISKVSKGITFKSFAEIVNQDYISNIFGLSHKGFRVKRLNIIDQIEKQNSSLSEKEIVTFKNVLESWYENKTVSEKELTYKVYSIIKKNPELETIEQALSSYSISFELAQDLFYDIDAFKLIKIIIKETKGKKDGIEFAYKYLIGNKREDLLLKYGYIVFKGELISLMDGNIIESFVIDLNQMRILRGVNKKFYNFLHKIGFSKYIEYFKNIELWSKISDLDSVVKMNDGYLLYVNESFFSDTLINNIKNYLDSLEGIISMNYMFNRHKSLMKENGIRNKEELFYITYKLFFNNYKNKLIFNEKRYYIESKEIPFNDYALNIISEKIKISISNYISTLKARTGLDNQSIIDLSESIFDEYKQDNVLSIKNASELRIDKNTVKNAFGAYFIDERIMTKNLEPKISKYNIRELMNKNRLKQYGLRKYKNIVYDNAFNNFDEAFNNWLLSSPRIIDENMIEQKIPIDSMHLTNYIRKLYLVPKGRFDYVNALRFGIVDKLQKFQDLVIDNLNDGEIFSLHELKNRSWFKNILAEYKHEIVSDEFGDYYLENIIKSSPLISASGGRSSAMKKGSYIKTEEIIYEEIKKVKRIDHLDLLGRLIKKYDILKIRSYVKQKLKNDYGVIITSNNMYFINKETQKNYVKEWAQNES